MPTCGTALTIHVHKEALTFDIGERVNQFVVDMMNEFTAAGQLFHAIPKQPCTDCVSRRIPKSDLRWNPCEGYNLHAQSVRLLRCVPDVATHLRYFVDFNLFDAQNFLGQSLQASGVPSEAPQIA